MLTAGDALTKTLAKSQKITFLSQKNNFRCFFFANCWRCSYVHSTTEEHGKGGTVALSENFIFYNKVLKNLTIITSTKNL